MKEKIERVLTILLVILVLPCALTLLLNGKMKDIYRAIQDEAAYISVKTNLGIREMNLEEYVVGVTATQIPLEYDLEAIKAQMVVTRTNLWRQMEEGEVSQVDYRTLAELEAEGAAEKFLRAQKETKGKILVWQGKSVMASFHALSAGSTRDGGETFLSDEYGYLQAKACPSDKKAGNYQAVVQVDESWRDMEIVKRDSAGYVQQLQIGDTLMSGEEFRNLLGLASANFKIEVNGSGVFLTTYGIGHGLGMSQYTAQQMALVGKDYKEILHYFYTGVSLEDTGIFTEIPR